MHFWILYQYVYLFFFCCFRENKKQREIVYKNKKKKLEKYFTQETCIELFIKLIKCTVLILVLYFSFNLLYFGCASSPMLCNKFSQIILSNLLSIIAFNRLCASITSHFKCFRLMYSRSERIYFYYYFAALNENKRMDSDHQNKLM